jgi:1,4-dihydroxy-2-naphthoate octaprenyltransferase
MDGGNGDGRLTLPDALRIAECRTKIVSLSSFLIGTAYALLVSGQLSWARGALMGVAALCVDLGTASFNSYFDFRQGVDREDTDVEHYKVLVRRAVDPRTALRMGYGFFALAAVPGLALGLIVGWEVVAIGAGCMTVSYFYSGGPFPLSRTPVGEVFAGGMLGSLLVALSAYVQLEAVPDGALLLGVPSTFVIAAILAVNNACDAYGDARAGRRTFAIVVGPAWARRFAYVLVAASFATAYGLIAVGVIPRASWLPLSAAAVVAAIELWRMHGPGLSHQTKPTAMGGISRVFLAYTVAMLIALGIGIGGAWL